MCRASAPQPQQAELAAHVVHLRDLGALERELGRLEVGAGVEELLVEPERVEVVADVVVVVDVGPRPRQRVAPHCPEPGEQAGSPAVLERSKRRLERRHQVALDLDPPVGVGVAEVHLGVEDQPHERAPVTEPQRSDRGAGGWREGSPSQGITQRRGSHALREALQQVAVEPLTSGRAREGGAVDGMGRRSHDALLVVGVRL
jgi:hypothetical protein